HCHSPWLMHGMDAAVTRTLAAIAQAEPIRILGDYDADGTLATVILRQALTSLGAKVSFHIPHRLDDGYGLQLATIERAAADGVGLAITVDNGIREHAPLARARELGLEVIVTDHHLPDAELPAAVAILNPHQPACRYPDKNLCGSGVAFKFAQALLDRAGRLASSNAADAKPVEGNWPPALRSYLKLVALATVADAVPLLGENRVLARFGLEGLATPLNPGLRALMGLALPKLAENPGQPVTSSDVGFRIAPRLNAAGRMGAASQVVELFTSPPARALEIAQALEQLNLARQQQCALIEAELQARAAADPAWLAPAVLVIAGAGWHRGVLGIVASRLLSRWGKPVVVLSLEPGPDGTLLAQGSGRAPAGVHLLDMLERCRHLLVRFGGHAQAVGLGLPAHRLPQLRAALESAAAAAIAPAAADPGFEVRLPELTAAFARELARLEPCGEGNREPIFCVRGVRLAQPPAQLKERHLKIVIEQDGARHTALFWNLWRDG
ncbi:MAG: single-stranded-DNA-specific exonuclease RecJ, partial [Terriglobales bacterium]